MSGEPAARFHVTYLVAGIADPTTGRIADESLSLLPNCFFVRLNHREESLVGTDEKGALYSFGGKVQRLSAVQVHPRESLELNFVPPAAIRESCLLFGERWQAELLAQVQALGFAPPIRGLPITFSAKHLEKPGEGDKEAKEARQKLEALGTLRGQLLPKVRVLIVLVDAAVLVSAPATLGASGCGTSFGLRSLGAPVPLEIGRGPRRSYRAYAYPGLPAGGGRVVVSIPSSALAERFRRGREVHRTIEVAFETKTLVGDFDFHVLDFPSVEAAILTHFAELFPHIHAAADEPAPGAAPEAVYPPAEAATLRARATALVASEKDRLVVGYKAIEHATGIPALFEKALEAVQKGGPPRARPTAKQLGKAGSRAAGQAVAAEPAQELGKTALEVLAGLGDRGWPAVAAHVLEAWKSYDATTKAIKSGKRLLAAKRNAAALGLLEERVSGGLIKRLFVRNKWREHALDELVKHAGGERTVFGDYVVWRKDKVKAEVLEAIVRAGVEPDLSKLEATWWAKHKAGVLWALDTAATMRQLVVTASEAMELCAATSLQHDLLLTNVREYAKRYKGRPCLAAIARLEVLRKQADASDQADKEKTDAFLKEAASATLKTLGFIPAVREVAACTLFAGEALAAAGAVADTVSSAVDRYLWRHRSARKRMSELHQVHATQCRAIEACGGAPDDPHTQLRMRIIALVGLLRLIERCGRREEKAKFREKAEQYQIGKYVQTFLTAARPPFTFAVSSGTPLDELWLYAQGNKNESWNEWFATVPSPADLIGELVHGTRTQWLTTGYHELFPVYGFDSADEFALARGFSLNLSGIIDKHLVYSAVYVRENGESPWVLATKAQFPIGPFTPVRIAAIFKSKSDLRGTPVSVQLKRVDSRYDGPVYKSALVQAVETADAGKDKGLLPGTEEARYIRDPEAYAFVCFPFYFYKKNYVDGLKPFGHIALAKEISVEMRFDLKVGDDQRFLKVGGDEGTVKVRFQQGDNRHMRMIDDRTFLAHKESGAYLNRLFVEDRVHVVGVIVRDGNGWKLHSSGTRGERIVLQAGNKFSFEWEKPLEMIILLHGEGASVSQWPDDPISFPARLPVVEPKFMFPDAKGPEYDVKFVSLRKSERFVRLENTQLRKVLAEVAMVDENQPLESSAMAFRGHGALFAAKFSFSFDVSDASGRKVTVEGFKPFGEEFKTYENGRAKEAKYIYHLSVRAPQSVGLDITNFLELRLPGLPASFLANTAFAGDPSFVTDKRLWALKSIQRVARKN